MTAAIAAMTLFASCSQDSEMGDSITQPMQGSVVSLSFVEEAQTRAFFDDDAAAETWEKVIYSATIFAFNSKDDALIVRRDFSPSELSVQSSTFALPGIVADDVVDVVVVVNCDVASSVVTGEALKAVINSNLAEYNGAFLDVNKAAKREDGFVMSSSNRVTVDDDITVIDATLERTVAKVAIQMSLVDGFSDRYSGDMRINSIKVSNTPSTTTLHSTFPFAEDPEYDFKFTQSTNVEVKTESETETEIFQNLFYIYESETPEDDDDKVLLTIDATYDMDGDFSETTNDQTSIEYVLTLEDDQKINRNSYYRISGSINGLSGSDASISITVSDWSTLTNKDVTLGN